MRTDGRIENLSEQELDAYTEQLIRQAEAEGTDSCSGTHETGNPGALQESWIISSGCRHGRFRKSFSSSITA